MSEPVPGLTVDRATVRTAFADVDRWFFSVLDRITDDRWEQPGLGEWSLRELAAHTARAYATIDQYLALGVTEVTIDSVVSYFVLGMSASGINEAIADRGRASAAAMGADPRPDIATLAERARNLVAQTTDDHPCGSAGGGIAFGDYLASRVFELTVHTGDLCAAVGLDEQPPPAAAAVTLAILAGLAVLGAGSAAVIRTLTGRSESPAGLNVLG